MTEHFTYDLNQFKWHPKENILVRVGIVVGTDSAGFYVKGKTKTVFFRRCRPEEFGIPVINAIDLGYKGMCVYLSEELEIWAAIANEYKY